MSCKRAKACGLNLPELGGKRRGLKKPKQQGCHELRGPESCLHVCGCLVLRRCDAPFGGRLLRLSCTLGPLRLLRRSGDGCSRRAAARTGPSAPPAI